MHARRRSFSARALIRWAAFAAIGLLCALCTAPSLAAPHKLDVTGVSDAAGLIRAIRAANSGGGTNSITLVPNTTITLTIADNGDPATGDRTGLPVITNNDLTINGNNSTILRNSGAEPFRFFSVDPSATLRLNSLTLYGGSIVGAAGTTGTANANGGTGGLARGGAIINRGTLVTSNLSITNCQAIGGAGGNAAAGTLREGGKGGDGSGGGIGNSGSLTMTGGGLSSVTARGGIGGNGSSGGPDGANGGNGGDAFGAAIFNDGTLTVTQTHFGLEYGGNTTTSGAGGNGGLGNVNVGDDAGGGGGGRGGTAMGGAITLWSGSATISQASFAFNYLAAGVGGNGGDAHSAGFGGGGGAASGGAIAIYAGNMTLSNSTFTNNAAAAQVAVVNTPYTNVTHSTHSTAITSSMPEIHRRADTVAMGRAEPSRSLAAWRQCRAARSIQIRLPAALAAIPHHQAGRTTVIHLP
ncbi:MAG: hypothetical protein ACR2JW_21615 [Thermomicrobiales bacterium]